MSILCLYCAETTTQRWQQRIDL